ncbi:MAG: phosphoribosyltransferase family protein [Nocardioides sp.]|nr:phosphoribosyltransferase family protein [Nocardioides sp.]
MEWPRTREFRDRHDAGRALAHALAGFRGQDVVVLGLPRGGVPVADVVARALDVPLDVLVVRKLGVPVQPELAMGAIGEGGVRVLNDTVVRHCGLTEQDIARAEAREREVLDDRVRRLRGGRAPRSLVGRTAIVVDDGVATGATARAGCLVAHQLGAARVVVAAPVAAADAQALLGQVADEVVLLEVPDRFGSVGRFYRDFAQVSDGEVTEILEASRRDHPDAPEAGGSAPEPTVEEVEVRAGETLLQGTLSLPADAGAIVLFAHGSGSSRHSSRNRFVAQRLNQRGLGTLLFDLLTPDEGDDRELVFDVELLAGRLLGATHWLRARPGLEHLPIGYFGASTGAAAALWAAASPDARIGAVVSRGGRPDLAAARAGQVTSPTLLVVGGADEAVLDLNRRTRALMPGVVELAVVPGASHLFPEPGALDTVADLAGTWFLRHLVGALGSTEPGSDA